MGTAAGALRGEMSFRCSAASTARLAQIFVSVPPSGAAEASPEHREAVLELLRQAGGWVCSAVKTLWGEMQLHLDASPSAPSWPASLTAWLQLGEDPVTAPVIEIQLSAALVAELRAEPADKAQATVNDSAAAPALATASAPPCEVNLDLLMEVELAVTLRFGSRRLLLRELLDLNPGAVIELDRQVQEPVDLLLDDRILARGEVVVLDGNYGLRVTEVAPPAGA